MDDDRILVGAPDDENFHGAAYVYERGSGDWSTCQALGKHSWEGDFGRSVALDGDWAAVGQWGGLPDKGDHGVVLFRRDADG